MASELDNNRKAFSNATVFGAIARVAMVVVVVAAFINAVVDVEVDDEVDVEVDDVVWVATRVVLVVEVDVVEVVEVVVDVVVVVVVVVVLGVAEATSDATLSPLTFSAFTVTAYVEPFVSDPTTHCNGCTPLTNVEQPSTPFKYTR